MNEVNAGGIPLMSFLTYVLQVNYGKNDIQCV